MPGYDQTGPDGYGAGTGRGMGPCGRGMACGKGTSRVSGRGFGRGRGSCRSNYTGSIPLSQEAQKKLLEAELARIEAEKAEIEQKLTSFE